LIAFVHIWKTAGTTFTQLLRHHYGIRHFDRPGFRHRPLSANDLRHIRRVYPGLKSIGGHPVRPHADLHHAAPNIRYHSFLRDPLDRSISHFTWFLRWKAHDGVLYDDFEETMKRWALAEENRNLQCRFFHPAATVASAQAVTRQHPTLLLRVDRFDASLLLFRQWAEAPEMDLHYLPRNTSTDKYERLQDSHPEYLKRVTDFRSMLKKDAGLQEILLEANQEDQALVTWAEEDVWPRQVKDYPGNLEADTVAFQQENQLTKQEPQEPAFARFYRNTVFKPFKRLLLPQDEPEEVQASEWL